MPNKLKVKRRRFTQVGLTTGMKHPYRHLHTQYGGFHTAQVQYIAKKPVTDRKSQFLTHLAGALKVWFSTLGLGKEIEIQLAFYDDDRYLLIASNNNKTAEQIYKAVVAKAADEFHQFLVKVARAAAAKAGRSKAIPARLNERHAHKLLKELDGTRDVGVQLIDDLKEEGKNICAKFNVNQDIDEFTNFLNGKDPNDRFVAILTSSFDMHAEQKILLGLCQAAPNVNRVTEVIVAGSFRPCRGCFESLSVVQRYCFPNLQFGSHPGNYWSTTNRCHAEILGSLLDRGYLTEQQAETDFDQHGRLIGLLDKTNISRVRLNNGGTGDALHYGSESDSEAD